ncbi:histidine kinase [uncultured Ruthenibacterium sp.]|uniref:sensor histidine kinase n=1 Tax=uncultured Ruthenibacterium sp. TaxID=1905347 RepID=UPI00349E594D
MTRKSLGKTLHIRRSFFLKNFAFTLGLMIVPIVLLTFVASSYAQRELRNEVERTSRQSLEYIRNSFDSVFQETFGYQTQLSANPRMNVHMITALAGNSLDYEEQSSLRNMFNSITVLSNIKNYVYSLYLSDETSEYMIVDGTRIPIDQYSDDWREDYWKQDKDVTYWATLRSIQRYAFEDPVEVITVFQRIMYSGVMVVNLRASYFETLLDPDNMVDGQMVLVFNEDDELLISNAQKDAIPQQNIEEIRQRLQTENDFLYDGYYISGVKSDRFGMQYISLIPEKAIYQISDAFIKTMLMVALLAVAVSILLAFLSTRSRYRQICTLLNTFELAEQGKEIPMPKYRPNDVYSYILESSINTFVQQSSLKMRISQQQLALLNAKLAALQYQINPHFLFNTLQSINIEIIRAAGRQTPANQMIGQLSDILRYSLGDPEQPICVREEIEILKSYVDLQRYRYDERFILFWDYPESCLSRKMPRMILQPLVENILKHGLTDQQATIAKIRIREKGDALVFHVIDNGAGISKEKLEQIRNSLENSKRLDVDSASKDHFNIGLSNIHQRLWIRYPNCKGLNIRSKKNFGTVVSFTIPIYEDGNSTEFPKVEL